MMMLDIRRSDVVIQFPYLVPVTTEGGHSGPHSCLAFGRGGAAPPQRLIEPGGSLARRQVSSGGLVASSTRDSCVGPGGVTRLSGIRALEPR